MPQKIKLGDYSNYPESLIEAAEFRDLHEDKSNDVFYDLAEQQDLRSQILSLFGWEADNTIGDETTL